jgi:hypothetical protein
VSLLVGRTPEATAAKQYESVKTFDYMGAVPPRDEPSRIDFITLKLGETYTFDTGIGSFDVQYELGEGHSLLGCRTGSFRASRAFTRT